MQQADHWRHSNAGANECHGAATLFQYEFPVRLFRADDITDLHVIVQVSRYHTVLLSFDADSIMAFARLVGQGVSTLQALLVSVDAEL